MLALKDALHVAGSVMLEPMMALDIRLPERCVGDVLSDLTSAHRRAQIQEVGSLCFRHIYIYLSGFQYLSIYIYIDICILIIHTHTCCRSLPVGHYVETHFDGVSCLIRQSTLFLSCRLSHRLIHLNVYIYIYNE